MTETGKVVVAAALSVLAHVSFFTVLALMPEAALVPVTTEVEEKPLEVELQVAVAIPEQQPVIAVDSAPVQAAQANAIRTQLDPENLKKAETAPENPQAIAAHHSRATPERPQPIPLPGPPLPTPSVHNTPDFAAVALEPTPPPPPAPTPQPEDEVGIDALGNYGKAVGNAIGVRSEFYRKTEKGSLAVGEVRIKFAIDAEGHVADITILSNTANSANATFAERAVKEAQIPPIPPERLSQVPGGRIKIVYTFTIY